jgi:hypothetical protein
MYMDEDATTWPSVAPLYSRPIQAPPLPDFTFAKGSSESPFRGQSRCQPSFLGNLRGPRSSSNF